MSLVEIKQHFLQVRMASLQNLSIYFNKDPETLRPMLQHWVGKGCLKVCQKTPACGKSCGACVPSTTEIYEWVQ